MFNPYDEPTDTELAEQAVACGLIDEQQAEDEEFTYWELREMLEEYSSELKAAEAYSY